MRSRESCQEPCPALTAAAVRGLGAVREFVRGEVRQTGGNIKKKNPQNRAEESRRIYRNVSARKVAGGELREDSASQWEQRCRGWVPLV